MRSHPGFIPINECIPLGLPFIAAASEATMETDGHLTAAGEQKNEEIKGWGCSWKGMVEVRYNQIKQSERRNNMIGWKT